MLHPEPYNAAMRKRAEVTEQGGDPDSVLGPKPVSFWWRIVCAARWNHQSTTDFLGMDPYDQGCIYAAMEVERQVAERGRERSRRGRGGAR